MKTDLHFQPREIDNAKSTMPWFSYHDLLSFIQTFELIHTYKMSQEKKEEIWRSPLTKAPTSTGKSKKQRDNTGNATKPRLNDCGPNKDGQLELQHPPLWCC